MSSADARTTLLGVLEDIDHLRATATLSDCANHHAVIRQVSRTLFRNGLISAARQGTLMAEADDELWPISGGIKWLQWASGVREKRTFVGTCFERYWSALDATGQSMRYP
uniref:Uncharacterized protein n=1 Tax=Pseudomonas graminis TaxID=158627 RepID=A0A7C2AJ82_9PSED